MVLEPEEGPLASLHKGEGRLANKVTIMNYIRSMFDYNLPLKGHRVLISAGPTREPIDPVRFISNRSSGKMGYAMAQYARDLGASVILVSGPVSLSEIPGIKTLYVETAEEMKTLMLRNCSKADYIFMVAAVSDYSIKEFKNIKIKRSDEHICLNLIPSSDILKIIKNKTSAIITAFALETNNGEKEAKRKMREKGSDYIVLNYANEQGAGFESNTNRVQIFSKDNTSFIIEKDRKDRVAKKIIDYILNKK